MSGERYVNAVVESVTRIGRYMIIKLRPLEEFRYSPGNSIDIFLDPSYCGGGKCFRVFSLASSPTEDLLMVATIYRGSMFKASLERLVGGVVKITGPWSKHFALREGAESLLFIPYGIGISSMRSMIKYIHDKCLGIRARLIHIDDEGFFLFREEIEEICRRKTNVKATFTTRIPDPGEIPRKSAALEAHSYMSQDPHRE
jgi:ferredoxin-NADP reductase